MSTSTDNTYNVHAAAMELARDTIRRHTVEEDGEQCFNLHTYLEDLPNRLGPLLENTGVAGGFKLDEVEVARYLWCCLVRSHGDDAYGVTFKGMPILD